MILRLFTLHPGIIRGHHVYMYKSVWMPVLEILLLCMRKQTNMIDMFFVCEKRWNDCCSLSYEVVASSLLIFMKHGDCATWEITGNWNWGHGLEILCVYFFVAKQCLVKKLESLLQPQDVLYLVLCDQHSYMYMVRTDFNSMCVPLCCEVASC